MSPMTKPVERTGEYALRGDYHRQLSPDWEFYPTYLAKLDLVRGYLRSLPSLTRVLDAGCGEGVLVEEFRPHLEIEGVDPNYQSDLVRRGSLLGLPYADATFGRALCLDVLEHLTMADQSQALAELFRVIAPGGELFVTVPNLAHLQSRIHFLCFGRLIRTANPAKHPGDRPVAEYLDLASRAGFRLVHQRGIFPTVPILTRLIRRHPARLRPLHRALTRLLPIPGWCFLNALRFARLIDQHLARSSQTSHERRCDLRRRRCDRERRQLPAAGHLRQVRHPDVRRLRSAGAHHVRGGLHKNRLAMGPGQRVHALLFRP
jgi:predicted SAM-dependent methyltransferase